MVSGPFPQVKLILTGIIVTLGGTTHYGYQISVLNPMVEIMYEFMNNSLLNHYDYEITDKIARVAISFVFGVNLLGAVIGCFIFYNLEKRISRKQGLLFGSIMIMLGCPLMIMSKYFNAVEIFCLGRLLSGVGVGLNTGFQTVYLSEISPIKHRGAIGVLSGFGTEFGTFAGIWLGYHHVLGSAEIWPYLFLIEMLASLLLVVFLMLFAEESPTYLYSIGKELEARKVAETFDEDFELNSMMDAIKEDVLLSKAKIGMCDLFRKITLRRAVGLSVVANLSVGFSGAIFMFSFGTLMLRLLGFDIDRAKLGNGLGTSTSLISSLLSIVLIDRLGRRKLLLLSLMVLIAVNSIMMIINLLEEQSSQLWHGYIFTIMFGVFLFMYSLGLGSVSWLIGTELAPLNARGSINALAIGIRYSLGLMSTLLFLPLNELIGAYSFLMFIIPLMLMLFTVFFYYFLPETKSKTIGDIVNELKMKHDKIGIAKESNAKEIRLKTNECVTRF